MCGLSLLMATGDEGGAYLLTEPLENDEDGSAGTVEARQSR